MTRFDGNSGQMKNNVEINKTIFIEYFKGIRLIKTHLEIIFALL